MNAGSIYKRYSWIQNAERQIRQMKSELENLKKEKQRLNEVIEVAMCEKEELLSKNNEKTLQLESLGEEEQK